MNNTKVEASVPNNRKLWQTFSILKSKEKKLFEKWLENELGPRKHKVLKFYQLMLKNQSADQIYKTILPEEKGAGSPFNSSMFRKLESQLVSYLEEYLAIDAFRKNDFVKEYTLIQEYSRRGSEFLFFKKFNKLKRNIESNHDLDCLKYQWLYQLEVELQKYVHKHQVKGKESLAKSLSQTFDDWWIHEKLKLANNDLNHFQIKGEEISTLFLDEILKLIENSEHFSSMPLMMIYKNLYKLRIGEESPDKINELIKTYKSQLSDVELKDIFSLIFNYYTRKVHALGKKEDLREMLKLFEWGIEDRLIFRDGFLPRKMYNNLITIHLRLGQLEEALLDLDKYKGFMSQNVREEAYKFNLACCLFAQKAYPRALKLFSQRFSNVYYEIRGRLIICRIHYELGETDFLSTELRSLRVFISRQKDLSTNRKKSEINQIKLFEQLLNAYKKEDYLRLLDRIETLKPLGEKTWILEKVHEKL